jgi:hypothetical protein
MSLTHAAKSWWLALTWLALQSCGGERIRLGDGPLVDAAAGQGAAGAAGADAGGSRDCSPEPVLAGEVLWMGDTWILIPGTQHTRVRDLARSSGALGPSEDYVNAAAPSVDMAAITQQYRTREASPTKVKVVLMDGGTWDPIAAQAKGEPIAPAIDNAIANFQGFLSEVARDGTVEHIVYFLVPELSAVPGVATMRPRLQQACADSTVPCHFLDLQPLWLGHPEYTAADGIQSSEAGARVIADSIWAIMQDNCIAQPPR